MKTIYKYRSSVGGDVFMPAGAEVIEVAAQDQRVALWAIVDTEAPLVYRTFEVYGTGHELPLGRLYTGTAHVPPFVWHVFEVVPHCTLCGLTVMADLHGVSVDRLYCDPCRAAAFGSPRPGADKSA